MASNSNDLILSELENLVAHLGPWSENLVLGGGIALIVYDRCMARVSARPVGTTDMDFLIPRRPVVAVDAKPLSKILEDQGFTHRHKSLGNPPVESYFKEVEDTEIEVEFLTDNLKREKTESAPIPEAGVVAQPLSYLEMSLNSVTTTSLPKGTAVRIVRPEAWIFHKGLTFTRRKAGSLKSTKDLYGIWFALALLGEFSDTAWIGLKTLQAEQPASWKDTFRTNLKRWLDQASPKDWAQLLAQDPEQRLTQAAFVGLVERLAAIKGA